MNLFLLSRSRRKGARMHCNRHVVKMILETTQLLWTGVHVGGVDVSNRTELKPYRKTHTWHPTAIWVRESPRNWSFAVSFGLELCKEYTRRYRKHHKCEAHLRFFRRLGYCPPLETRPIRHPRGAMVRGCTPLPLAMPESCVVYEKGEPNAVESYRRYYALKNAQWAAAGRPMRFNKYVAV